MFNTDTHFVVLFAVMEEKQNPLYNNEKHFSAEHFIKHAEGPRVNYTLST